MNLVTTGYGDCHLQSWAARYYFPDDHDPRWLAIELAMHGQVPEPMTFRPEDVYIEQPNGSRIPLVSQRTYRQQRSSMAPLLLQVRGGANRSLAGCGRRLRFFVDDGIRQQLADVNQHQCVQGYLYFAAPSGAWASGTYVLAVNGDIGVRLPIEIE